MGSSNVLLIATMVVLVMSLAVVMNLSLLDLTGRQIDELPLLQSVEISFVPAGVRNSVDVEARNLSLSEVAFVTSVDVQNVILRFTRLDARPALIAQEPPADSVFQYFQVISSIDPAALASVELELDVPILWMNENNVSEASVLLVRWDTTRWVAYNVTVVARDADKITFESSLDTFSIFAVAGNRTEGFTPINVTQPTNETPEPTFNCPDGFCDAAAGETCGSCPQDCGPCPAVCGDAFCDTFSEDASTCPQDCAADNTGLIIIIVVGAVVAIAVVLLIFLGIIPTGARPAVQKPAEEFIPGEEDIVSYINQMRAKGYSDAQIRAELVKAGWRADVVDNVLAKYRPKTKK